MRYLSLGEALLIAEAVTRLEASTLIRVCQLDLLDSALHAPQAGVGDKDFYPSFVEKAAVLVMRVVETTRCPMATSASDGRPSRCSAR